MGKKPRLVARRSRTRGWSNRPRVHMRESEIRSFESANSAAEPISYGRPWQCAGGAALAAVESLFLKAYSQETGTAPTDDELVHALALMRIEVLDVDPGGDTEREAKSVLRDIVLADPAQSDAAWAFLIHLCAQFAETRAGTGRSGLQRSLQAAGFSLKVPRSYEPDVAKLRSITGRTKDALTDLATIRVAGKVVRIDRAVTQEIQRLSASQSILVVGEPGAGKSGTMVHFAEQLKSQDRDYVMLAVDRLTAASEGELRVELGLEHNLDDVLENWEGNAPAFLIIDALDAARGGSAAQTIRSLIARVTAGNTRWRVIASIRKFDLRYSEELRDLFVAGSSAIDLSEFRDREFLAVSHVNVRALSNSELQQVQSQSPDLATLVNRAPAPLHDLLRNPFNLRLLAALLSGGMTLDQLTPIQTQLQLLDKYWRHRVIGSDRKGDMRELVIRRVCEAMTEARMLRVDLARVADVASGDALTDLKSAHVLVEWQPEVDREPNRYVLAFSHHVLFDYGAARLLLRGDSGALVRRIEQQPELTLILHPSFSLHFHYLWRTESKASFWGLTFQLVESSGVPEIGKLIGPAAAAELGQASRDFDPLLSRMRKPDAQTRSVADQVFEHIVGAILVAPRESHPLVGPAAGPWAELMEQVSRNLRPSVAYSVCSVITTACESGSQGTLKQLADLGAASRSLLEFAWRKDPRDEWLVARAIDCVSKTFESTPSESAHLLRRTLVPEHLREYGFEEMPWLCRQVHRLMTLDPHLVEDIYVAVFGFHEKSDVPTAMNPSRILRLTGNRRQDYEMARFELATVFPNFLSLEPERATRALIAATEAYVREEHAMHDDVVTTFAFRGRTARFVTDYSSVWDARISIRNEDPVRMLEAFMAHCGSLAEGTGGLDEFRRILTTVVEHNQAAVLWRRLLLLGVKYPGSIGPEIAPLASAFPVLTGTDTSQPCGEYLHACFSLLPTTEREAIEHAILAIPDLVPFKDRQHGEAMRDRLLGCLSPEDLSNSEAKALLHRLIQEQRVPDNEPPVRFQAFNRSYGEVEYLKDQGVAVESEANANIQRLEQPVVAFASKHQNSTPTADEIEQILSALRALH